MKIKKLLCSILTTVLCFSFVSCSSEQNNSVAKEEKPIVQQTSEEKPVEKLKEEFKESSIHFIDTGNSDAILIKGEKSILIDAGDNDDEKLIVDYLGKQGVKELEYVISTHPDADHCGGLDSVFNNIKVNNLLIGTSEKPTKTYEDFIKAAANKGLNGSTPLEGAKFDLGNNSYIQMVNVKGGSDANESSLVTLYINGNDKFLLTGDAGEETENKILNDMIDIDVLKVGHHGSKTSTSENFLNKVNPEFAVITVGKDNSYGHPHIETMGRLKGIDSLGLHRTDECGTIIFKSTGNGVSTDCKIASFNEGTNITATDTEKNNLKDKNDISKPIEDNKEAISNTDDKEKSVWLSATGSKYHSINNCGKMNPNKARKVTLKEAQASYEACSKCN